MPQLDRIIIFPQIFWFFILFILFYVVLTHFFLPAFLSSLKARKELVQANLFIVTKMTKEISEDKIYMIKNINSNFFNLQKAFCLNTNKIQMLFLSPKFINPIQLDHCVIKSISQNVLFCNKLILKGIQIQPLNLNLTQKH